MTTSPGRDIRKVVPRSAHGDLAITADRRSPVDVIVEQNEDRLSWLIPIRHWRMAQSPLDFYRGTARLMAIDLATTPTTGVMVQIGGDAHLSNFGFYGSPERHLVFDLNDFDETLPGPWEWDVKRLAASFAIAARSNGFGDEEKSLAAEAVAAYRKTMKRITRMGYLDVWYSRIGDREVEEVFGRGLSAKDMKAMRRSFEDTRAKGSRHAVRRLTETTGSDLQIKSSPPLIIPLRDLDANAEVDRLRAALNRSWEAYLRSVSDQLEVLLRRFRLVDVAIKAVGVGSVGTRCFIVLLEGRDQSDPLFLQVKQAGRSVLEEHLPASRYSSAGQRVVEGQRLMQAVSDIFLGWTDDEDTGRHYYWRQLKDMKASADVEEMDRAALRRYADLCGWTLAKAHARSGDADAISGYLGRSDTFDIAIGRFAVAYADQNEKDFDDFKQAIQRGDIPAHRA